MDTGYYNSANNIFNRLMLNLTIENNIFQFDPVQKINLVSIPDELIFYNVTNGVQDENKLPNDTFFDANHKLYQNRAINKTFKYYYLDYQYIVKDPVYSTFYDTTNKEVLNYKDDDNNFESIYVRKTYYGRTNRLKFKLCHNYCGTCYEFGINEHKQECLTCLTPYQYDYWYYLQKYIANCVPEGKYYDLNISKLVDCDSGKYKYFYPETNKKICFKYEYECPPQFRY